MNEYEKRKQAAREKAIAWQSEFAGRNYSYGELAECQAYFTRLGKRFGLTREFQENGII